MNDRGSGLVIDQVPLAFSDIVAASVVISDCSSCVCKVNPVSSTSSCVRLVASVDSTMRHCFKAIVGRTGSAVH